MGDFLSIMSAAFDSFFGFIFWAVAYYQMNKPHLFSGVKLSVQRFQHLPLPSRFLHARPGIVHLRLCHRRGLVSRRLSLAIRFRFDQDLCVWF